MEYKQSEEFKEPSNKTNVIISAFCSAYARIKLWQMMNKLGNRVCIMIWIQLFTLINSKNGFLLLENILVI